MTPRQLNQLLLKTFPALTEAYHEEVDWQEGDDTGSHVVYGDVLCPIIRELVQEKDYASLQPYMSFIETLLELKDDYAANVAIVTLLETLYDESDADTNIRAMLKPLTLKEWDEFAEQ